MPSRVHEVLAEMIRHRPAVVAELLSGSLKVELPDWRQVRTDTAELTDLTPVQYRADAVTVFADTRGATVFAVVNEIQLRRDPRKRRTWPHYLTSLHARLGCPTMLLVMCTDMATARWCAAPIEIGHPGWVLRPLVVGPDTIPMITDVTEARRTPELAVLSAIAHGRGPEEEPVFQAMLTALQTVDQDHFELYPDIVLTALPEAARHCLEALMDVATYEFQSDHFRRRLSRSMAEGMAEGMAKGMAEGRTEGRAEGRAAGRVEGEARALLAVLSARGDPGPRPRAGAHHPLHRRRPTGDLGAARCHRRLGQRPVRRLTTRSQLTSDSLTGGEFGEGEFHEDDSMRVDKSVDIR